MAARNCTRGTFDRLHESETGERAKLTHLIRVGIVRGSSKGAGQHTTFRWEEKT
jgi:hypothetical protein